MHSSKVKLQKAIASYPFSGYKRMVIIAFVNLIKMIRKEIPTFRNEDLHSDLRQTISMMSSITDILLMHVSDEDRLQDNESMNNTIVEVKRYIAGLIAELRHDADNLDLQIHTSSGSYMCKELLTLCEDFMFMFEYIGFSKDIDVSGCTRVPIPVGSTKIEVDESWELKEVDGCPGNFVLHRDNFPGCCSMRITVRPDEPDYMEIAIHDTYTPHDITEWVQDARRNKHIRNDCRYFQEYDFVLGWGYKYIKLFKV